MYDVSRCGMTSFAHSVLTEASNVKGSASRYAISVAMYASRSGRGETGSQRRATAQQNDRQQQLDDFAHIERSRDLGGR